MHPSNHNKYIIDDQTLVKTISYRGKVGSTLEGSKLVEFLSWKTGYFFVTIMRYFYGFCINQYEFVESFGLVYVYWQVMEIVGK